MARWDRRQRQRGRVRCDQPTAGGVGYVELDYAIAQHQTYGDVKNKAGNIIEPCEQTAANATVGITSYPADLRVDIINQSTNPEAYPITGLTWALVYQNQTKAATAAALVNFFSWISDQGAGSDRFCQLHATRADAAGPVHCPTQEDHGQRYPGLAVIRQPH